MGDLSWALKNGDLDKVRESIDASVSSNISVSYSTTELNETLFMESSIVTLVEEKTSVFEPRGNPSIP